MSHVTSTPTSPTTTEPASGVGRSSTREGSRVVVIGGGPGGYEAALVARQLGAEVTVVERQGMGGSAVLTDVVPSKTLIATAEWMTVTEEAADLGIRPTGGHAGSFEADFATVDARVLDLAKAQSADIRTRLEREGVALVDGEGRMDGPSAVIASTSYGEQRLPADVVLLATGARPRVLPTAVPDGERILNWTQLYQLTEVPERLIVVGSGVTGAEFAGAYNGLGADVVLVSSRDRVLPGEDPDAAELIETVFKRRGMEVLSRSRAAGARRVGDGVEVELADGRVVQGSHCLIAVGAVPNTDGLELEGAGVKLSESGHIQVDRVSRTTARGVYAAGDCTGVLALASVAAMQGRIAMWHSLGDAVSPLDLSQVSANVFTAPEIATVGIPEHRITSGEVRGAITTLPLARNPRAKMLGIREGFVKMFSHRASGLVIGGVVVGPRASELIFPITLAISNRLTVDQVSSAFTVYPSLSGTIAEAARTLHDARG
ncbi:NAD(P)H-quinone dehydrogenase [Occultella kanbiaonis]|uniref:NAD(P)H-quinone dehydrogenase n=1 Tax=Occultella kanbiaonis TaxID=2675754 RepID=UPI0013D65A26|nr:NAD(P)H-quinone dehydrogenase [Occultella kanbiaonis]